MSRTYTDTNVIPVISESLGLRLKPIDIPRKDGKKIGTPPDKQDQEWSDDKRWNPFNSYKLLSQTYRWRLIQRGGQIPQPVLVTIDPVNACDLNCHWCNSSQILEQSKNILSRKALLGIADFLPTWKSNDHWEKGVESICIAGGGEPLLNPYIGEFIDQCVGNGIHVGVVTNGTHVDKFIPSLAKCTWVGVSLDAGEPKTFQNIKGKDKFEGILNNMKALIEYSRSNKTVLSLPGQGYGVSYKYLLHPDNMAEVFTAAQIAKSIGCRNFHLRPAGIPWHRIGESDSFFSDDTLALASLKEQLSRARDLENKNFGVFGITHKFDRSLNASNHFYQCHAIFMTAVFMPASNGNENSFNLGLCCDRRGDSALLLGEDLTSPKNILSLWGGKHHWGIFDKIDIPRCPRCTYQPHNQLFEKVILEDNMTYRFI